MFSCICPYVGEEMWQKLGHDSTLAYEPWPTYDEANLVKNTMKMAISVNGKTRDVMEFDVDISQDNALTMVKANPKIVQYIDGKEIKKIIFVKGRICNIVV